MYLNFKKKKKKIVLCDYWYRMIYKKETEANPYDSVSNQINQNCSTSNNNLFGEKHSILPTPPPPSRHQVHVSIALC